VIEGGGDTSTDDGPAIGTGNVGPGSAGKSIGGSDATRKGGIATAASEAGMTGAESRAVPGVSGIIWIGVETESAEDGADTKDSVAGTSEGISHIGKGIDDDAAVVADSDDSAGEPVVAALLIRISGALPSLARCGSPSDEAVRLSDFEDAGGVRTAANPEVFGMEGCIVQDKF
jgi:hypothetical protein